MNWRIVARMLGLLGLLVGGSMLFSLPWAFPFFGQVEAVEVNGIRGIVGAMLCSLVVGGLLYFYGKDDHRSILRKEAFAVVGLGWLLAGILGALPFLISKSMRAPGIPMSPADAIFESISGFTTTGASVLTELEDPELLPRCIMFWRCFTHWLGGMGIIVLFVAILGQLGAGGKAMLKREVPGPITESVRPRVRETALTMWAIYVALTFIEAILLCLEGIPLYHSLCHAFGTMATGGFSTFNKSAGHFDGGLVEATIVVFMILAGINFSLYYLVFRKHGTAHGWKERSSLLLRDYEFRSYLTIIGVVTVLLTASLMLNKTYPLLEAFRHSLFATVSVITTTGFGTENFAEWNEFAKGTLLMLMFVGGCAGSTGGGIKVIRWVILTRVLHHEIERAFRPSVVRPVKMGESIIEDSVRRDILVYFCMIMLIFGFSWLMLITIEPDTQWSTGENTSTREKLIDCASAIAATLNNIGPGIGLVGPAANYSDFSPQGKLLLTTLMLLGRLELFAILVLFSPRFWRNQ